MEKVTFSTRVEQLKEMGLLSDNALMACRRLSADDAFTLANYMSNLKEVYTAANGDFDVLQEIVMVAMETYRNLP